MKIKTAIKEVVIGIFLAILSIPSKDLRSKIQ